jgi:hypothetical protein
LWMTPHSLQFPNTMTSHQSLRGRTKNRPLPRKRSGQWIRRQPPGDA